MNTQLIANFKKKIAQGDPVLGPFMKTTDPAFVEAAGWAGMDFAILDMEHGPISTQSMQNNIRGAQLAGILPIVRVASLTEEAIGKALDIGAAGVEVPQITSAKELELAIQYARFHPEGSRGVCRFVRAAKYSATPREEYFPQANQAIIVAQLEGVEAIHNLDEILEVQGADILFIGPYDLSQSLGVTGQTTHPKVVEAMKEIIRKAQSKGVTVGTFTDNDETMAMWMAAGVQYISYSVDVGIFYEACKNRVDKFLQHRNNAAGK